MKNVSRWILLAFLVAVAIGCAGNREKELVGKWTGKASVPDDKKNDPNVKMAEAFLSNASLELKEDKKFTMTIMFPFEGTWSVSGDTLALKVEKFMGMTVDQVKNMAKGQPNSQNIDEIEKPMEFKISGDNKTLTAVKKGAMAGPGQGDLVFTKS